MSTFSVLAPEALLAPSILRAPRNVQLDAWLKQTHRVLASDPTHALATSALHKLRLEACRRTGNLGVQHARAVFPNY